MSRADDAKAAALQAIVNAHWTAAEIKKHTAQHRSLSKSLANTAQRLGKQGVIDAAQSQALMAASDLLHTLGQQYEVATRMAKRQEEAKRIEREQKERREHIEAGIKHCPCATRGELVAVAQQIVRFADSKPRTRSGDCVSLWDCNMDEVRDVVRRAATVDRDALLHAIGRFVTAASERWARDPVMPHFKRFCEHEAQSRDDDRDPGDEHRPAPVLVPAERLRELH